MTALERLLLLTPTQTALVWSALAALDPAFPPPLRDPPLFLAAALTHRLDHARVVLPMARTTTQDGVQALETLVGRPITRRRSAPPATASFNGRRKKTTAPDLRTIHDILPNPKRPESESALRYARYSEGMTVADALAAGLRPADIRWDVARAHITLRSSA